MTLGYPMTSVSPKFFALQSLARRPSPLFHPQRLCFVDGKMGKCEKENFAKKKIRKKNFIVADKWEKL